MRTIKFRGKDFHSGEWFYGNLFVEDDRGRTHISTPERGCLRIDTDTVGQFVGITDEYGKEVFEGDVLEANYKYDRLGYNGGVDPDNDCICYGVVEFDNDALQWVLNVYKAEYPISEQIEEDGCSLTPLYIFGHENGYDNCNLRIIGNRFDNPELLKGGEK